MPLFNILHKTVYSPSHHKFITRSLGHIVDHGDRTPIYFCEKHTLKSMYEVAGSDNFYRGAFHGQQASLPTPIALIQQLSKIETRLSWRC